MPVLKNAREEKFCQGIIAGLSLSDAYAAAGYKPNRHNAASKAKEEHVAARILELQSAVTEKVVGTAVVDKAWVIARLVENVDRAMTAIAVTDREGNPTGEWKYEGGVANKALELLGKDIGMFVDRTKNINKSIVAISDEPLTAAEWAERHVTGS